MPTISNTPRPGFVYDSTDDVWYPIGTGTHNHSEIAKTLIDAKGDLIVGTAADTVSRLAVGATNGMVLTVDSAEATGLKYATPSSGGMTLLSTTSLSGTSTTVSSISQSYTDLYVIVRGLTYNAAAKPKLSSGAAPYTCSGTTANAAFSADDFWANISATSFDINVFSIPSYTNSSYQKAVRAFGFNNSNGTSFNSGGGFNNKTSAVTELSIGSVAGTSTMSSGQILIYGVN